MAPFNFNSDKHFVASSDGTTLQVHELTTGDLSSIRKTNWKEVATILPNLESTTSPSYDGLLFPDGRGNLGEHKTLTGLAQHLAQLRLMVGPEGYCYQDVTELPMYTDFDIHYFRLNDLFCWSGYGVEPLKKMTGAWTRSELKHRIPEGERLMSWTRPPYIMVRRDQFEDLKRRVQLQEDDIEKLTIEVEEGEDLKVDELRMLRKKKDDEMRRAVKQKNDEIRGLKDQHDDDVEKLNIVIDKLTQDLADANRRCGDRSGGGGTATRIKELEDAVREKDKEVDKLKEDLADANKRCGDGSGGGTSTRIKDLETTIKEKDKELDKLKEDLAKEREGRKDDESRRKAECDKKLAEKDDEIKRIKKEKDDAAQHCWRHYPSVTLLQRHGPTEARRIHLSIRKVVPPGTFNLQNLPVNNDGRYAMPTADFVTSRSSVSMVDDESSEWLSPPRVDLDLSTGVYAETFDVNNWWYMKTTHPEGGLTMLAYYDSPRPPNVTRLGSQDIPLPYAKAGRTRSVWKFYLVDCDSLGYRVAFMYRN